MTSPPPTVDAPPSVAPSVALALAEDARRLCQALLRMDTTNPPGNERRCAEYLVRIRCTSWRWWQRSPGTRTWSSSPIRTTTTWPTKLAGTL